MEKKLQFYVLADYATSREYLKNTFFPKFKKSGVGAMIQILKPRVQKDTEEKFTMRHVLEKSVALEISLMPYETGTYVDILIHWRTFKIVIISIIGGFLTCGVFWVTLAILFMIKGKRCQESVDKAKAIIEQDLGAWQ